MFKVIKNQYLWVKTKAAELIQRAETELPGKSGPEKRKWVVELLDEQVHLNKALDDIFDIDGLFLGYIVDKVCDAANILTGGDIARIQPMVAAHAADADVHLLAKSAGSFKKAVVENDEDYNARIKAFLDEYGIKPEEKPVASAPASPLEMEAPVMTVADTEQGNWRKALNLTFGHEGAFSDDPDDRGGPTNMGITAGTLASAYALGIVSHNDIKKLTRDEAANIYYKMYWQKCSADKVCWFPCYLIFDTTVNGGIGMTARCLQYALNEVYAVGLVEDGKWGPKTQAALLKTFGLGVSCNPSAMKKFGSTYLYRQMKYYDDIVKANPKQGKFLKGWHNRIRNTAKSLSVEAPKGL